MAHEREIEELEAGDEIRWACPGCENTFVKKVGKGITMSLLGKGSVSFPCPVCSDTVEVGIERIDPIREETDTDYDPTREYNP